MEPYSSMRINVDKAFVKKKTIRGQIVAVLDLVLPERELHLITPHSRALKKYEIHELFITNDPNAKPGDTIKGATYICFFEVIEGGISLVKDKVIINGLNVGEIIGFDETHMPNHLNIVCYSKIRKTGKELGLNIGDEVFITRSKDL